MDKKDDLKYCPRCGAEYGEESTTCADCEEPLVFGRDLEALPRPDNDEPPLEEERFVRDDEEFVIVARNMNIIQKNLIASALDDAEIPYYISGDAFSTVQMYWSVVSRVWVPEHYVEQAKAIIDPLMEEQPFEPTEEEGE